MNPIQQQLTFFSIAAFVGTSALLAGCLITFAIAAIAGARRIATLAAGAVLTVVIGYSAVLLVFALLSREVILPLGAEKYFCEIDCHIANSVAATRLISAPDPELSSPLQNQLILLQVRTRFDPATISPRRGDSPLMPNPRRVFLRDATGRKFEPSAHESLVLASLHLGSTPMRTPLRPGESYSSYFVFETPAGTRGLRFGLQTNSLAESLLWGNELSPLHKKIYFALFPTQDQVLN